MSEPSIGDEYRALVEQNVQRLYDYFGRQQRWYRALRLVVIGSAATVPVFASIGSVPRPVVGLMGAIAAVAESIQQLFQFRTTSLHAMKGANEMERELARYVMAVGRYAVERTQRDSLFAERIEDIRAELDGAFLGTWQTTSAPRAGTDLGRAA